MAQAAPDGPVDDVFGVLVKREEDEVTHDVAAEAA